MKTALLPVFLFLVVLSFVVGCASYRAIYDVGLTAVERPAEAKVRFGEQRVTALSDSGIQKWLFEDSLVQILWIPTSNQFNFVMVNKTDHTIKIIWDEAAYVDESGESHRVMHAGVKYADANSSHPPSVIVRNANLHDLVLPADNVHYIDIRGIYSGWDERPLFPNWGKNSEELKAKAEQYKGKTVQVLLPLEIEGVVNEYVFRFEIKDVRVK